MKTIPGLFNLGLAAPFLLVLLAWPVCAVAAPVEVHGTVEQLVAGNSPLMGTVKAGTGRAYQMDTKKNVSYQLTVHPEKGFLPGLKGDGLDTFLEDGTPEDGRDTQWPDLNKAFSGTGTVMKVEVVNELGNAGSYQISLKEVGTGPGWAEDVLLNPRIFIRGGEFFMGLNDTETGWGMEMPAHKVTLSSFYLQEHEVTIDEYHRFDPSRGTDYYPGDYPIYYVTWAQAQAYAEWLGGSLPTEAQWEFAARGSEGRMFPWGNSTDISCSVALTGDCESSGLVAVKSRPDGATPEGILGLADNAKEWVLDWFDYYPDQHQIDPTGPENGQLRSLRGGGAKIDEFRGAWRGSDSEDYSSLYIGFRVAFPAPTVAASQGE